MDVVHVHVVVILVVIVIVFVLQLTHQLSHQARLFQIQILSVSLEEVVLVLNMETSLNCGSRPKLVPVLEIIILDPLQSTGQMNLDVMTLTVSMVRQIFSHQEIPRLPKLPST